MNGQETAIRNKLTNQYAEIFEEKLIDEILKVGYYDEIYKGSLLIDTGDVLTHIPLILAGVVKISREEQKDHELTLYYLEPGDTCAISFANCINRNKSIFKGTVEANIEALFIPIEFVDEWLVKFKSWRHFIIDSYHFRLLEMVESIDSLAFMNMKGRTWKYLTDKVKISNNHDLEITHQQVAQDLNSTRVVISRILKQLQVEGIIDSTRNRIQVLSLLENQLQK